jgi:hypothetical protein
MGPMSTMVHLGVPLTGTIAEGASCTRIALGNDNCNKGQFCTSLGTTLGERHCRHLCHGDSDCAVTDRCLGFLMNEGVCVRACTPFGSDCGAGLTCADIYLDADGTNEVAVCRSLGASTTSCSANTDCAANLVCTQSIAVPGSSSCSALCDNSHACGGIFPICQPLTGLPNGGGYCLL